MALKQVVLDINIHSAVSVPLPDGSGYFTMALVDENDLDEMKSKFKSNEVKEVKDKDWSDLPEKYKKNGKPVHEFWGTPLFTPSGEGFIDAFGNPTPGHPDYISE